MKIIKYQDLQLKDFEDNNSLIIDYDDYIFNLEDYRIKKNTENTIIYFSGYLDEGKLRVVFSGVKKFGSSFITRDNFFKETKAVGKPISELSRSDQNEIFRRIDKLDDYDFYSNSGSEYYYFKDFNVRISDHGEEVASCHGTLSENENRYKMEGSKIIAYCKGKDFERMSLARYREDDKFYEEIIRYLEALKDKGYDFTISKTLSAKELGLEVSRKVTVSGERPGKIEYFDGRRDKRTGKYYRGPFQTKTGTIKKNVFYYEDDYGDKKRKLLKSKNIIRGGFIDDSGREIK